VRAEGTFIAIEVDDAAAAEAALAAKLTEACPVDIFAQDTAGKLELVEDNLDECVLCRLCLDAVESDPTHPVKVIKLYDNDAVLL
jgi:ferredoxin-like protein FixX